MLGPRLRLGPAQLVRFRELGGASERSDEQASLVAEQKEVH